MKVVYKNPVKPRVKLSDLRNGTFFKTTDSARLLMKLQRLTGSRSVNYFDTHTCLVESIDCDTEVIPYEDVEIVVYTTPGG